MAVILRYFTEFGSFRGALRKRGWKCRRKKSSRSLSHFLMSFLLRCASGHGQTYRHIHRSTSHTCRGWSNDRLCCPLWLPKLIRQRSHCTGAVNTVPLPFKIWKSWNHVINGRRSPVTVWNITRCCTSYPVFYGGLRPIKRRRQLRRSRLCVADKAFSRSPRHARLWNAGRQIGSFPSQFPQETGDTLFRLS